MRSAAHVIHSDPETMGGTPVFVGTRVPVQTFLDFSKLGIHSTSFWRTSLRSRGRK